MYAGPDAILRRWLRAALLDRRLADRRREHARPPGPGPARAGGRPRDARRRSRRTNPDAYLMGEHFYDATDQLDGDQWDGVMNYAGFATPGPRRGSRAPSYASHGRREVVRGRGPPTTASWSRRSTPSARPIAVGRRALPVQPARQPRHGPHRARGRRRSRAASGRRSGCCSATSACPAVLYGDEVGLEGADGDAARAGRCPGTRPTGTSTSSRSCARSSGSGSRSRRSQVGGFQVLEAGEDCARVPARHGRASRRRRGRPRTGARAPAGAAARRATGRSPTGRRSLELFSGARRPSTDGRLPTRRRWHAGAAIWTTRVTATVSQDFVFGTLATDDLRLAQLRRPGRRARGTATTSSRWIHDRATRSSSASRSGPTSTPTASPAT